MSISIPAPVLAWLSWTGAALSLLTQAESRWGQSGLGYSSHRTSVEPPLTILKSSALPHRL